MELIVMLAVAALLGWLNYYLAGLRGRSQMGWAIGAVFFGIFAVILLLILGKTEQKQVELQVEALKQVKTE
jgi:uncharacterized membrane protein YjjB (DUF3815 family)